MVQLRLPKNSRVLTGKTWPKPEGASNIRKFKIYRWSPDDDEKWRVHTLAQIDGPNIKLSYRDVIRDPLTDETEGGIEIKKIAPKERTF